MDRHARLLARSHSGMRLSPTLLAVVGIGTATSLSGGGAAAAPRHAEVRGLAEESRAPLLAAEVAADVASGRWIAAGGQDLIVFERGREVARFPGLAIGAQPLAPLSGGGWVAGARILAADGTVRFDGHAWSSRYGRFAHAKAFAPTPDGRVAIIAGADSPSRCLRDRGCGSSGSHAGALVRLTFGEGAPVERVLIAHADRRDFTVAAGPDAIAAIDGAQLKVWPARGDGPPIAAPIAGHGAMRRLLWSGDRYLIAVRYVDPEHDEVLVFDRAAGFARARSFVARGHIVALAARPGASELALALTRYRATSKVEIDEKALEVVDFTGARRARVELGAHPLSVAWTPDGEALLAAVSAPVAAVLRYAVK